MADYPYTPLYYNTPVLVSYLDQRAHMYKYGIAYHDILIKYDGAVEPLTTCIIEAQVHGIHWDDAIIERDWINLDQLKK